MCMQRLLTKKKIYKYYKQQIGAIVKNHLIKLKKITLQLNNKN